MSVLLTFPRVMGGRKIIVQSAIRLPIPPNVMIHCRICGHGFPPREVFPVEGPLGLDSEGYECRVCVTLECPVKAPSEPQERGKVIALTSSTRPLLRQV